MARLVSRRHGRSGFLGRHVNGPVALYAALAIPLALISFIAPFALVGAGDGEPTTADAARAAPVLLAGLLPLVAAPILAVMAGLWAAWATRDAGDSAVGGAVGSLVGTVLLFLLAGIGFGLGAALAGADAADLDGAGVTRLGVAGSLGYILSGAGVLYLLFVTLVGGLAGAAMAVVGRKVEWPWTRRESVPERGYRS